MLARERGQPEDSDYTMPMPVIQLTGFDDEPACVPNEDISITIELRLDDPKPATGPEVSIELKL